MTLDLFANSKLKYFYHPNIAFLLFYPLLGSLRIHIVKVLTQICIYISLEMNIFPIVLSNYNSIMLLHN